MATVQMKTIREEDPIPLSKEEIAHRTQELQEKEDLLAGKEQRLSIEGDALATREQALYARQQRFEDGMLLAKQKVVAEWQKAVRVVKELNRYLDFAKLSHYQDLERRLGKDDVENLLWALNQIKEELQK